MDQVEQRAITARLVDMKRQVIDLLEKDDLESAELRFEDLMFEREKILIKEENEDAISK